MSSCVRLKSRAIWAIFQRSDDRLSGPSWTAPLNRVFKSSAKVPANTCASCFSNSFPSKVGFRLAVALRFVCGTTKADVLARFDPDRVGITDIWMGVRGGLATEKDRMERFAGVLLPELSRSCKEGREDMERPKEELEPRGCTEWCLVPTPSNLGGVVGRGGEGDS